MVGLAPQAEYPQLEAFLEHEVQNPTVDWRILQIVFTSVFGGMGALGTIVSLAAHKMAIEPLWVIFAVAGIASWFVCGRLLHTVRPARLQIHKKSEQILGRLSHLTNLVGIQEALAPEVGMVLDEAAGIYRTYCEKADPKDANSSRAIQALEAGMAKLLDLGTLESPAAQTLEFDRGWAMPLLREMRRTAELLDRQRSGGLALSPDDPLATLREARAELEVREAARIELDQG